MNKNYIAATIVAVMLPLSAYAGAATSIGNGISDVVGGVGTAVTDVGRGVGNGVSAVGNGIGDAFSGNSTTSATRSIPSDATITSNVYSTIQKLADAKQITPGYDLQVQTTNGVVVITGVVVNAADTGTIRGSIIGMNGVKDVDTEQVTVQ